MAEAACFAVIPAAGIGRRMGEDCPKQYLSIAGKTILEHTLDTLLEVPGLQQLVVVLDADDKRWCELPVFENPRLVVAEGGQQRCHSVLNGLKCLQQHSQADDWVLVHDIARPCIQLADIQRLLQTLSADKVGGLLALPVTDTIKQVDSQHRVTATLDRTRLWQAQTPQMFRYGLLHDALAAAVEQGQDTTDEAAAVERAGFAVKVVEGSRRNLKVTSPEDLALAEFYLTRQ